MDKTQNAIVDKLSFDRERGFTIWVQLSFRECSCQSFGGYQLFSEHHGKDYTGYFLNRLFNVFGTDNLEDITGTTVRFIHDDQERIVALGHIVKDIWLDTRTFFDEINTAQEKKPFKEAHDEQG